MIEKMLEEYTKSDCFNAIITTEASLYATVQLLIDKGIFTIEEYIEQQELQKKALKDETIKGLYEKYLNNEVKE